MLKILKWIRGILLLAVGCMVGMCAAAGFPQMMLEYFNREIADNDGILFFIWLAVWFMTEMGFLKIIEIAEKKGEKK